MPTTSSRKMAASSREQIDGRNSGRNGAKISTRDHDENARNEDGAALSKTNASPSIAASSKTNGADCSSSLRFADKATKNSKEERSGSPSGAAPSVDRGDGHKLSISSFTRDSSKLAPISSSPSRTAESSRTHLFSPQPPSAKQSNHRADYDQLDLDDTMMGEAPFQFEVSPQRDLARPSPGGETAQEVAAMSSSRKRGSSRSEFPYPTKRSHMVYPHHSYYPHAQEDPSGNANSSSKIRNQPYYNFYGHPYPPPTYHGESRTPSRGTHQQGGYSGYSPYHGLYAERSYRDTRPFSVSAASHPPYESDEEGPPSPPPSPGARVPSTTATASTPEKVLESMGNKSPFRSPPRDSSWVGSEMKSTIGFRPSPFFQRSPGISGSFDMGTPNGTLTVDDDNLGPIFQAFEDASTPCTLRSFDGGALMSIGRSLSHGNSEDTPSPTAVGRDRQRQRSPLTSHMNDLSSIDQPILHGTTRSPPHHDFERQVPSAERYLPEVHSESFPAASSAGGRKYSKTSAVTMSGARGGVPSSRLDPGAQPKQLWPPSSDTTSQERTSSKGGTPGPVRLEIGGTGSLNTRKTFEGINIMMQPRSSTNHNKSSVERKNVSGYITTPGRSQPSAHHHRSSHHSYAMGDIATPRKTYNQMRSGHVRHQYSYPPPVGSGRKPIYPLKADSHYSIGGAHKPMYMSHPHSREGNPISQHHSSLPPSDGKENSKKKVPKRSPCNCKRSRCLKLYCECFAAERFCQGCNCVDCGNTPESGEIREKAIKDTRAKNSKAFQNRFSLENSQGVKSSQKVHNMGCKCKKSACLKKYCECFNAGALCGTKCKCSDCLNYAGSQALIDKRRKIKDRSGAEYALRVSDEQWKSGSSRKAPAPPHRRHPMPSVIMPPHHTMYPSPRGHPPQGSHSYSRLPPQRQYYMGMPTQMIPHGHPHTGYAPMNMPVTPGYHRPTHSMYRPPHSNRLSSASKPIAKSTTKGNPKSTAVSPKTPGIRKPFDPATSRKKRKTTDGESEPTESYFGEKIKQPKTTALAVFSFLSNDDLYHASLVNRRWGELAFDDELWKFQ